MSCIYNKLVRNGRKETNNLMFLMNVICVIMAVYLPTSKDKVIYEVNRIVFVWAVLIAIICVILIKNECHLKRLIVSLTGINAYMLIVTLIAANTYGSARLSVARFAPIICLLFLCSIQINHYPSFRNMELLLNIISITAIVWNVLILANVQSVLEFTYNYFNQYAPNNGYYQLIVGHKPVMSFGVHTYAPYFYFFLFVLCFSTYKNKGNIIYIFYSVAYSVFTLFCVSTTGIAFFLLMILFLLYEMRSRLSKTTLLTMCFIIFLIFMIIYRNFDSLYQRIIDNITNGDNSFVSRYSSDSVFNSNFRIITSSFGIGYNIVDELHLGYSDSGYIVYLTMGNIPFMLSLYYNVFVFLKNNLTCFRTMMMIVIFSFEIALPATFNYRFSYMIIFVICYMGALTQNYKSKTEDSVVKINNSSELANVIVSYE